MTEVRSAVPEDRAGILALCQALHSENGQHPIDWAKVEAMVDRGIAKDHAIFGVIGPEGEPKAAMLISLEEVWYSGDYYLLELFNFVHRDNRRSDYAKSLISYAKRCADQIGVSLMIGVISNERMEAKVRLYGRLLPKAGEFFQYDPTPAVEMSIAAE